MSNKFLLNPVLACVFLIALLASPHLTSGQTATLKSAKTQSQEMENDWIRGAGKSLEMRLRGKLIREPNDESDCSVEILLTHNDSKLSVPAIINGDQYEAWLPVGSSSWYFIAVHAQSKNGNAAAIGFGRDKLRSHVTEGLDLKLTPSQNTTFKIVHAGQPVSGASVRATFTSGTDIRSTTNEQGEVSIGLPQGAKLRGVTAWKKSSTPLMGV